jgi:SAM-dependent methyltransferase
MQHLRCSNGRDGTSLKCPSLRSPFCPHPPRTFPFRDQSFHAVISNGVFNLIPEKVKALAEVLRVLEPGGRLMVADQVLTGELPEDPAARPASWAR